LNKHFAINTKIKAGQRFDIAGIIIKTERGPEMVIKWKIDKN